MSKEFSIVPHDTVLNEQPNPVALVIERFRAEAVYTNEPGYGYTSRGIQPEITDLFITTAEQDGQTSYTHLAKVIEDAKPVWKIEHIDENGQRTQGEVMQEASFSAYVGNEPIIPILPPHVGEEVAENAVGKITGIVTDITAVAADYLLRFFSPTTDGSKPSGPIPDTIRRFIIVDGNRR